MDSIFLKEKKLFYDDREHKVKLYAGLHSPLGTPGTCLIEIRPNVLWVTVPRRKYI